MKTSYDPADDADNEDDDRPEPPPDAEPDNPYSAIFEKCRVHPATPGENAKPVSPEPRRVVVVDRPVVPRQVSAELQLAADLASPEVQRVECRAGDLVSPEEVAVVRAEVLSAERWSDATSQDVGCDPPSEYYTASSEVSLASEGEAREGREGRGAAAGHVAAMRERFESMTRANTPADLTRPASPADRANITPSPDLL